MFLVNYTMSKFVRQSKYRYENYPAACYSMLKCIPLDVVMVMENNASRCLLSTISRRIILIILIVFYSAISHLAGITSPTTALVGCDDIHDDVVCLSSLSIPVI